ncbi:MAG: hypothetical protein RSB29_05980 [Alistipes sp.]
MLVLLWAGVVAYIVFAAMRVRTQLAQKTVKRLTIQVADSSMHGQLVSSQQVSEWLSRSGIHTLGRSYKSVDLAGIEALIARNGFVDRVNAYLTYGGELHIDVSQRRPVVRMLTDSVDFYLTSDGYAFPPPRSSALYVPIITGSYHPPFPTAHAGSVRRYIDQEKRRIDQHIAQIEQEKYPFYRRERTNDENIRALRRLRIKKGWFESDEAFEERLQKLRAEKITRRRSYRYEEHLVEAGIAAVEAKQAAERNKQKKLEKNYEDFSKLITFVKSIEKSPFWQAEVVQIVASTSVSGELEVELIPRSGNHRILFGRIENVERKFEKLLRFYRCGLDNLGWDSYRTIDVRYADQVVCVKNKTR